ncbi:apolipoprotein N-acyltransferase [Sorangium sp. So ce1078]|uniref:apolipoprotein N-acyltransferase n=1 Tax=Sorangium sp. So ce1078 TaxID=3133329 RepID=UPI003F608CC0
MTTAHQQESEAAGADVGGGEAENLPLPEAPRSASAPSADGAARPLPARLSYGLAALTGFLYFLGFPGVDLWPISFFGLVPLIVALRGQTPGRAALLGWISGFVMTMTGFYWLLEMLRVFSGFPTILCIFFMAILCAYQAGRIALCGWLYGRAEARGWPGAVVFALAFVTSELVYPLLFPWYYGSSVHNAPVMGQVADLGGPYLVGLVLVAANLAIAELVKFRLDRALPRAAAPVAPGAPHPYRDAAPPGRGRPLNRAVLAVGVAAPALAAVYGVVRMRAVDAAAAAAEPIKIGIVQPNLALFDRRNAVKIHVNRTKELAKQGAGLVVWSEAGVPQAFRESAYKTEVQRSLTGRLGVPTVVGTVIHRLPADPNERGVSFNTALMAGEGGEILGRYDKQYLLAFGEYLPLGDTVPYLYTLSPNSGRFSPGTSLAPLEWDGHRLATMICYEDILPHFVNKLVAAGDPDLLVNLTNDAWFGDTTEPWIHLALAKMRAIEHRRYLVRATNSGVSAIVDPVGRVVVHSDTFKEQSLLGEARFMRARTVYGTVKDIPWYVAAVASVAMALFTRPERLRLRSAAR